jgi:hypothetical protein
MKSGTLYRISKRTTILVSLTISHAGGHGQAGAR